MSLTQLNAFKDHLRIERDYADEDTLLQIYLDAAERAVSHRVQRELIAADEVPEEGSTQLSIDFDIQAAIFLFGAHLNEVRTIVTDERVFEVPKTYDYLLAHHRNWASAEPEA